MELKIWGDAENNIKNTNLLVIMRMRLRKKIGPINLINQTRFVKKMAQKDVR